MKRIVPDGLHRIRYYGLFANGHRAEKLALCRRLLDVPSAPAKSAPGEGDDTSVDEPRACPCCGGRMIVIETFDGPQASDVHSRHAIRFDSS